MDKKKKNIIFAVIFVVVIAILLIIKFSSSGSGMQGGMRGPGAGGPVPVKAHILKPQKLNNNVITTGSVLANESVELKSETSGKVVKILFKEGSRVKKGDLLLKINDEELQAQLLRAKSALNLAQENFGRQKSLYEKQGISKQALDAAQNDLNAKTADLALIKAQIDKTEIIAPFDGQIGLKYVSEGSFVNSSTTIVSLQDIDPIKIDFSIPEKYAGYVSKGDKITFKVSGNNKVFTGAVFAIEPQIDLDTRTLKIRAIAPNAKGEILPGSFADVTLILKEINDALMVPTQAIIPILKGQKVYLYKNGVVSQAIVNVGIRTDTQVQLTSGVSAQDTVITTGVLQIMPGVPVKITDFN
jgi:membrane fusion protein (multidrug efflux system)